MEEKKTNQVEDLKSSVKNTIKGIKDKATSDETKEKIKGAVDSVKDNLTKENLDKAVDTVKDNLTKENLDKAVDTVKENLTKENLEKTANAVKESLTKENLEKTVSNIKESLNEENREETIKRIKAKFTPKKVIAIIAIVLVIFMLFRGCGGSKNETEALAILESTSYFAKTDMEQLVNNGLMNDITWGELVNEVFNDYDIKTEESDGNVRFTFEGTYNTDYNGGVVQEGTLTLSVSLETGVVMRSGGSIDSQFLEYYAMKCVGYY